MSGFALEQLFDAVSERFASESSQISVLDLGEYDGTAAPSISGTPTADACARVRFPTGGEVGVDGIVFQTSADDGTTWSDATDLGTATTILLLGVTLALGAGSVANDDEIAWVQSGPAIVTEFGFGWRESAHRSANFRVIFEPGDDGDIGEVLPPLETGGNPRSLADLDELFTVIMEAYATPDVVARFSDGQKERPQYAAARALLSDTWRSIYLAAPGLVQPGRPRWGRVGDTLGAVSQLGVSIRLVCSIRNPLKDAPLLVAPASTSAVVATTAVVTDDDADLTETDSITKDSPP